MFKKILVAIDGSDEALKALKSAIEMQKLSNSEILLLCVFKHHSLFESSLSILRPPEEQIPDEALTEFARDVVNQAKEFAKANGAADVRGFVKSGRPSTTIVQFAEDNGVDLIVMGAHGTHSKDGMFLGSVAHRVATISKCPILIVKNNK